MKLAACLVWGVAGAALGAGAAWVAGFGLFGILIAYVLAGMLATLGAAVIAFLVS